MHSSWLVLIFVVVEYLSFSSHHTVKNRHHQQTRHLVARAVIRHHRCQARHIISTIISQSLRLAILACRRAIINRTARKNQVRTISTTFWVCLQCPILYLARAIINIRTTTMIILNRLSLMSWPDDSRTSSPKSRERNTNRTRFKI